MPEPATDAQIGVGMPKTKTAAISNRPEKTAAGKSGCMGVATLVASENGNGEKGWKNRNSIGCGYTPTNGSKVYWADIWMFSSENSESLRFARRFLRG